MRIKKVCALCKQVFIKLSNSKLSLISISSDPDERINQTDPRHTTKMLILDNQLSKEIVRKVLQRNYTELEPTEIELLVDFSNGIPFIATIMATDPNKGKYHPGTLRVENIINRLLGQPLL